MIRKAPPPSQTAGDAPTISSRAPSFAELVEARYGRREILKGMAGAAAFAAAGPAAALADSSVTGGAAPLPAGAADELTRFPFTELVAAPDDDHHVAPGHTAQVLIRWGEPVLEDAPGFAPGAQTAAAQARQFGYNNDFVGYIPMPDAADPSAHGLLMVNHEYTNEELMFPGVARQDRKHGFQGLTAEQVAIEMAAHGGSVIEIRRDGETWTVVPGSRFARRITADTPIEITGPAAGDARLRTADDTTGRLVRGMVNNCSGGVTPWGTWLSCEENFDVYFMGSTEGHPDAAALALYTVPAGDYAWGRFVDRFDVSKAPNEPNRFGWVVEIDPFHPASTPKKRTALGRLKHEAAANLTNTDGRLVVYMGDDEANQHVYRFVSAAKVDPADRAANANLLDAGELSVAIFRDDGTGTWVPLTSAEGFSATDVLINTRAAATALKATPMDRPEDVEADPRSGKVYVMLTNNKERTETDRANPRKHNTGGHIIEITPAGGDHAADSFAWDLLVLCGKPEGTRSATNPIFAPGTGDASWFANPDNCAVDHLGRLWVATDGNTPSLTQRTDGIWALETQGPARGTAKHLYAVPMGAEMCGPFFTPDDTSFFVAVQHPGEGSTFDAPSTRWPDRGSGLPPRPAVVVITRTGGGRVGT